MIRGCGIDIVSNRRFLSMSEKLVSHLFSISEQEEAQLISDEAVRSEFYASRFAAKEALSKACGTGFRGFSPSEVTVKSNHESAPFFILEGRAAELVGRSHVHLSISHEKDSSVAMVVLDGEK